ncbi:hypothetical protein IE53DRAFT_388363 [Violaceomyces palustris]|uniref:Uncharacterized protein n=1 Tax=Violaceomyces palustris TaxID=1673888 RepID=A0ACD0NUH5_9BASI|nr:hypothetical protein IE53DRAFT_388363 [Violaceomyces palustris]
MAATQQPLYQSAAIFAGGLAIGAGALALSRSAFAPATKPTKSTKRKLSDAKVPASRATSSAVSEKLAPVGDKVSASNPPTVATLAADAVRTPLAVNEQPKLDEQPEPSVGDRVKHIGTPLDLAAPAVSRDDVTNAQAWLNGIASSKTTSTTAIDSIAYSNSTAIFAYESAAIGGFGQFSEAQSAEATTKGWFQGRPKVFSMQTRTGAGAAIAGYLSGKGSTSSSDSSSKVVTALTNASGLLAMAPALSALGNSTGDDAKLVLQVSAASQLTDGDELNVKNDYASILAATAAIGDAFEVVLSGSRQEAVDLAHYAYKSGKNVIHVFDGAFSGREVGALDVPTKESTSSAPQHFSYTGPAHPTVALVVPNGSHSLAARAALVSLPQAVRSSVGLLSVRIARPWSDAELRKALPSSVESIHVLEELRAASGSGILHEDVVSSLFSEAFLTASSSPKSVLPLTLAAGQSLSASEWNELFISVSKTPSSGVKIADVISNASASSPQAVDLLALSGSTLVTLIDSETSTTANLASVIGRTFRERGKDTNLRARLLSRYDNYEATGIVRSDIVLTTRPEATSDAPIEILSSQGNSHVLIVSDPATTLKSYAPFSSLRNGGTILFNTPGWDATELEAKLRAEDKRVLAEKDAKLYLIDAAAVVEKINAETANALGGKGKAGEEVVPKELATAVLLVAFLRAQLGSSGQTLVSFVKRILGTAPLGVAGVEGLVSASEKATEPFNFDVKSWSQAEPISEAEANAAARPTEFRYNGFGPNADAASLGVEPTPVRTTWALPAWQHMFSEAYDLKEDSLRPDLPEKTWVVKVTENRRLTPVDYDRNVFHMELSTAGTGLKYEVGEALGVHGWNDADEVSEFIKWAGLDADEVISVPSLNDPSKFESRTVFQVLQQRLDIFGKPPKRFYEELSKLATNRDEARWLRFISSAEGSSTFKKLSEVETVTYADVLRMFPSARLPLDKLMTEVEPIKPRHYSIASAQAAVGDSVHLLIVTVDWKTPSGAARYGQCTRYLSNLKVGAEVTVSLKPSVMKLPPIDTQPIIMAGLGTGAAPFRAFIQARAVQKAKGLEVGPLVYYFGSRYRSAEYLYGEELEAYTQDGVIQHMGLAFSRDTSKKVYIQHKIQQDGDMLTRYLAPEIEELERQGGEAKIVVDSSLVSDEHIEEGRKGYFFVCGPTWPVPDIHEALVSAFTAKGWTKDQAEAKMEALKEEERYVLEVY